MYHQAARALRKAGLYYPLKRAVRYLRDSQYRARINELKHDLRMTREAVGDWASQPIPTAAERGFAVLSFTNLPLHAKFHNLIAKTMQLHGYTPVIFNYAGNRFGNAYFKLFGIDQIVLWDQYANDVVPPGGAYLAGQVDALLPAAPDVQQALALQFHGVEVGKHALSVTSRALLQGNLDLAQPDVWALFRKHFQRAVQAVLVAEHFFDHHPVQKMLVRDAGYIPNGAIYETALLRGIDCVVYEQGQRRGSWILKRYTAETRGQHYFSLDDHTWEQVQREPWTAEDDQRLEKLFAGRYKPDSTDDTRRLMTDKQIMPPEAVRAELQLDPGKKTAVIFSHIAWDAAFFFGSCLFDDFEDWLYQTVQFVARECPHMNWVVKLHPFNVFKLQREGKSEESEMRLLRDLMPLPDHVRIMRANTPVNTQSLFPVVDYVLTVNGTVGMEFPCYGVPAVLAGTGRYNGKGFTIEPPAREAYFEQLRTLHEVPPLDTATQARARQHFYTVVERRQTRFDDIAPMELKRMNEAQSDVHDNIHITARSLDEFQHNPTIQRVGAWLADSDSPDILEPLP